VIASSGGLTIDSVAKHSRRKLPPLPLLPPVPPTHAPAPPSAPRSASGGVVERMSGRFPVPPMTGRVVKRGPSTPELGASS